MIPTASRRMGSSLQESGLSPDMLSKNCLLAACACAARWIEATDDVNQGVTPQKVIA